MKGKSYTPVFSPLHCLKRTGDASKDVGAAFESPIQILRIAPPSVVKFSGRGMSEDPRTSNFNIKVKNGFHTPIRTNGRVNVRVPGSVVAQRISSKTVGRGAQEANHATRSTDGTQICPDSQEMRTRGCYEDEEGEGGRGERAVPKISGHHQKDNHRHCRENPHGEVCLVNKKHSRPSPDKVGMLSLSLRKEEART